MAYSLKQNVDIIHTSKSLELMGKHTIVRIKLNVHPGSIVFALNNRIH